MARKAISKREKIQKIRQLRSLLKADLDKQILSIDPATNSGWAFSISEYGTKKLKKSKKEHMGHKLIEFEHWVRFMMKKSDLVVTELPVTRYAAATIHHSKLVGIIEKVAAEFSKPYFVFDPKTVKKFATGSGVASKIDMIEQAKKVFGYVGEDDNEVDAIWLLLFCKQKLLKNES